MQNCVDDQNYISQVLYYNTGPIITQDQHNWWHGPTLDLYKNDCHNQILEIYVGLYIVDFSRTEPQCIDWHLFFFIPYGASCFSVLVLVSIIDSARVVLPALLGLYKVWVLQFWGRAHDFHTQIWPHTEFGNCLVTKSPDWRLGLLLF